MPGPPAPTLYPGELPPCSCKQALATHTACHSAPGDPP